MSSPWHCFLKVQNAVIYVLNEILHRIKHCAQCSKIADLQKRKNVYTFCYKFKIMNIEKRLLFRATVLIQWKHSHSIKNPIDNGKNNHAHRTIIAHSLVKFYKIQTRLPINQTDFLVPPQRKAKRQPRNSIHEAKPHRDQTAQQRPK